MEFRERPIIFSPPMVRAILEGRKTQTRRVMKAPKGLTLEGAWVDPGLGGGAYMKMPSTSEDTTHRVFCPYGGVGDRLWVRETWGWIPTQGIWTIQDASVLEPGKILYAADHPEKLKICKPSIHMPRWASRILLEVVSVRVERLQDLSENDAIAEGLGIGTYAPTWPLVWFEELWRKINGWNSWDANPWVWVIEFRRVEQ